jgi:hypothetical protein
MGILSRWEERVGKQNEACEVQNADIAGEDAERLPLFGIPSLRQAIRKAGLTDHTGVTKSSQSIQSRGFTKEYEPRIDDDNVTSRNSANAGAQKDR